MQVSASNSHYQIRRSLQLQWQRRRIGNLQLASEPWPGQQCHLPPRHNRSLQEHLAHQNENQSAGWLRGHPRSWVTSSQGREAKRALAKTNAWRDACSMQDWSRQCRKTGQGGRWMTSSYRYTAVLHMQLSSGARGM